MNQFTEFAKQCLLDGKVPRGLPDSANPFERDRGSTYCRFDGIEIKPAEDKFGGTMVGFLWRGRVMCWVRVAEGSAVLNEGMSLHLHGIHGRQRVDLS